MRLRTRLLSLPAPGGQKRSEFASAKLFSLFCTRRATIATGKHGYERVQKITPVPDSST